MGKPTNTTALRELIQQTHLSETCHGHLADPIASHPPHLYRTIQLQDKNTEDILTHFIHVCVEQVPNLLDAVNSMACEAGTEERIKPVSRVAGQFFLTPSALLADHDGLDVLLDEAYLVHRLTEEVNDRYVARFGQVLILLNTAVASLVVYQLAGKPFANRLDEAIHRAMENMLDITTFDADSTRAYCESLKNPRMVAVWQQWPCLPEQLGVEFSLS